MEKAVVQVTLDRPTARNAEPRLSDHDLLVLSHLASGMTADVAARSLDFSSRTFRRRMRTICDRLDVDTPIEAVVWAAKRGLI